VSSFSLVHLVFPTLSEDSAAGRLEEGLLAVLSVRDLVGELLRIARKCGPLVRVLRELVDHDALAGEGHGDVVQVFALVEADLDAAGARADALHVVLVKSG